MLTRIAGFAGCIAAVMATSISTAHAEPQGGWHHGSSHRHFHRMGYHSQHDHGERYMARGGPAHRFGHDNRGSSGVIAIGNGNVVRIPGIGTYSGSINVVGDPKTGLIFTTTLPAADTNVVYQAPKATIIDVEAQSQDHGCSMEAGVCVIRGS